MEDDYEPSNIAVKANALIGNDVLSKEGDVVGEVEEIYIHPEEMDIEGISVDTGWFSSDIFFGASDIKRLERGSVVLKVIPLQQMQGKTVRDNYGDEVGSVKNVKKTGRQNRIVHLVVERSGDNDLIVAGRAIRSIGKDIVVKGQKERMASKYRTV